MALQIGQTLGRGSRRALSKSGIALMILTVAFQFAFLSSLNAAFRAVLPAEIGRQAEFGLTLPVPEPLAWLLALASLVGGVVLYVVGARALVRDVSELRSLPTRLFTRRIGRATLSALGAGAVVAVAVALGSLLVVPGLFFAVSFAFVTFLVAIEDERALPSLRRSWEMAAGNRWRLFAVVLVVVVANLVVGVATGVVSLVGLAAAQAVNRVVSSVLAVVFLGFFAEAFVQLRRPGFGSTANTSD